MKTQQNTPASFRRFDSVLSHSLKINELQKRVPLGVPLAAPESWSARFLAVVSGASALAMIAAFVDRDPLIGALGFVATFAFGMASAIAAANHRLDATGEDDPLDRPIWEACDECEAYFCNIHQEHAADCPCPGIDEWDVDPYSTPVGLISTTNAEVTHG